MKWSDAGNHSIKHLSDKGGEREKEWNSGKKYSDVVQSRDIHSAFRDFGGLLKWKVV